MSKVRLVPAIHVKCTSQVLAAGETCYRVVTNFQRLYCAYVHSLTHMDMMVKIQRVELGFGRLLPLCKSGIFCLRACSHLNNFIYLKDTYIFIRTLQEKKGTV